MECPPMFTSKQTLQKRHVTCDNMKMVLLDEFRRISGQQMSEVELKYLGWTMLVLLLTNEGDRLGIIRGNRGSAMRSYKCN